MTKKLSAGCLICALVLSNSGCSIFPRPQDDAIKSIGTGEALNQSEAFWREGSFEQSKECLEEILSRNPADHRARLMLADLLLDSGDISGSEQELRRLLSLDSGAAQAHCSLGLLLDCQGRHDEAVEHLMRAVELEPANESFLLSCEAIAGN